MRMSTLKIQSIITKIFLWTSPLALVLLLAVNFPNFEKSIWTMNIFAPFLATAFAIWLLSLLFVIVATFVSSQYKETIIHDVVLHQDRDERETFISGQAAKKSILITLVASLLILICTTGQYNKAETTGKSSITIGHFQLTDNSMSTTQAEDSSTIIHYQLPMSKMSLVLLLILIQLTSFHAINFISLRRLES